MNRYQSLLGIVTTGSPPNHFELLGISQNETDPAIIKQAAQSQLQRLRPHVNGPQAEACKRLAAEIKKAYAVLSSVEQRSDYISALDAARAEEASLRQANPPAPAASADKLRSLLLPAVGIFGILLLLVAAGIFYRSNMVAIQVNEVVSAPVQTPEQAELPVVAAAETAPVTVVATVDEEASEIEHEAAPLDAAQDVSMPEEPPVTKPPLQPVAVEAAIETAPPLPVNNDTSLTGTSDISLKAHDILQKHCFGCHGEGSTSEGGFGFVLSHEKLISSGLVIPNNLASSPLVQRLVSTDSPMPPEDEFSRPSEEDRKVIMEWVRRGAKPFREQAKRVFVSNESLYNAIADDLEKINQQDRNYMRYFSVVHLANADYSDEEIGINKVALAKLLNSLSWNRQIAEIKPIAGQGHVYRIDLRDLKWGSRDWEKVISRYPYGLLHPSEKALRVRTVTGCEIPVVRADWFVAEASRPPLYHELAQIPETDAHLEKLLQVDVSRNLNEKRAIRIGFTRSGVSQHNRLIERHESIFGAYWKSYDFSGSTGRKNLFNNPLGPGTTAADFDHDGGEIIFRLPNGMLAYMLTDGLGRRIDKGPTNIVSDPSQPDRAVVNGVSCMSCHYNGFIPKSDEIRSHVIANRNAFSRSEDILSLYAETESSAKFINEDINSYLAALANQAIGITRPTKSGEPIVLASLRYQNELDLALASAELGIAASEFAKQLSSLSDATMSRQVGTLLAVGGVIKRETFEDSFFKLASLMNAGEKTFVSPAANVVAAGNSGAGVSKSSIANVDLSTLPLGVDQAASSRALSQAIRLNSSTQWQQAGESFDDAIRLATTQANRLRACEQAVGFYERSQAIESLLQVHKYFLDNCTSSSQIIAVRQNLLSSLQRVREPEIWNRSMDQARGGDWPLSIVRAMGEVFEPALKKNPGHEPTLRALQSYYSLMQPDEVKLQEIFQRLIPVIAKRGEKLDTSEASTFANLLVKSGDPARAAVIYAEQAGMRSDQAAANLYYLEGAAWAKAKDVTKAVIALKKAQRYWQTSKLFDDAARLGEIGDVFMEINDLPKAIAAYEFAIRKESNPGNIQRLQAKLAAATRQRRGDTDEMPTAAEPIENAPDTDELLDPRRSLRAEAQQIEDQVSGDVNSRTFTLIRASEAWLKAGEPARVKAALDKAASLNRNQRTSSAYYHFVKMAKLYADAGFKMQAVEQWILAIQTASDESQIIAHQAEIQALLQSDLSMKPVPEHAQWLDPNYAFRFDAKKIETLEVSDPQSKANNLIRAAKQWIRASETNEAIRCLSLAEKSIQSILVGPSSYPQESLYQALAESYGLMKSPEDEVRCLVAAMRFSSSDSAAQRHYKRVQVICNEHSMSEPKLDAEIAKRLDPLNQYRVQAADYETRADSEANPSVKSSYFNSALSSWLRAENQADAIRVANKMAQWLMKNKSDSQFEYQCKSLGDTFVKLGRIDAAIRCYEESMLVAKSDRTKVRLQQTIDNLKAAQPASPPFP